jgi:hypothetical protein
MADALSFESCVGGHQVMAQQVGTLGERRAVPGVGCPGGALPLAR